MNVDQKVATSLETATGKAIFVVDRTTWYKEAFITTMKLFYNEGYQLYTRL
jgi:GntR family histidine utilization transcriptional repressor